jgi:hypothetical protein
VKELELSYTDPFYVTNGTGVLLLSDSVQSIISVAGASQVEKAYYIKLDEFKDITSITNITIQKSSKSEGDIANLSNCTSLSDLNFEGTKVCGNIISIANCTSLTYLNFKDSTKCEGNLSEFAISQIDNYSRTSGSVEVHANANFIIGGTRTAVNGGIYTINYVDSTHFNIVLSSYTLSYTKSGGVWTYEETA